MSTTRTGHPFRPRHVTAATASAVLAIVLFGASPRPDAQQLGAPTAGQFDLRALAAPNTITASYSGEIFYKGEGYVVTATVTKGVVVCQGTFLADKTYPISGRGRFELEMDVRKKLDPKKGSNEPKYAEHQYRFTLHCPFPENGSPHGESLEELAHSYEQPGGQVTFDPATCDSMGRPGPGYSGSCKLKWPAILKGSWSDTTGEARLYMSWALCQQRQDCPAPAK
jgi:hypothetical protein